MLSTLLQGIAKAVQGHFLSVMSLSLVSGFDFYTLSRIVRSFTKDYSSFHFDAIIPVSEFFLKTKWPDFTHFSNIYYFLVCTGVKVHIFDI